jgi:hypothetical protein
MGYKYHRCKECVNCKRVHELRERLDSHKGKSYYDDKLREYTRKVSNLPCLSPEKGHFNHPDLPQPIPCKECKHLVTTCKWGGRCTNERSTEFSGFVQNSWSQCLCGEPKEVQKEAVDEN